jgi:hypothetical protein
MKTYRYLYQVGKARHVLNWHDGTTTHGDGSPFYSMKICGNKRELARMLRVLQGQGYLEE